MKRLQIVFSEAAVSDVLGQADWYQEQATRKLAKRWETAVKKTLLQIARNPFLGPVCNFQSKDLADVRRAAVAGFSRHLIFYRLQEKQLMILRVIHGARDLESLL